MIISIAAGWTMHRIRRSSYQRQIELEQERNTAYDQQGHEAGDELLQGAAYCLQNAFESLGTIYRVGGDEFTGILHGTEQQLEEALKKLEWITNNWSGKLVKSLSISIGYASVRNNPNITLNALMIQADNAMYENKRKHYERKK